MLGTMRTGGVRATPGPRLQRYVELRPGDYSYPRKQDLRVVLPPNDPLATALAGVVSGRQRVHARAPRPALWADAPVADQLPFFTRQQPPPGSRSHYAPGSVAANVVRPANTRLLVSDDGRLAVDARGEAKTFFAEDLTLCKASGVTLEATGRSLRFSDRLGVPHRLAELQPAVDGAHGLDVRTPQDCERMAAFVSGRNVSDAPLEHMRIVASLLDRATGDGRWVDEVKAAKNLQRTRDLMFVRLRKLDAESRRRLAEALGGAPLNERADPRPGAVLVTFGSATTDEMLAAEAAKQAVFEYHYGAVVARSGTDYVTLENYARRKKRAKHLLMGGDPLFFFRMYGRGPGQTWHERQSGDFLGQPISFVVS